MRNRRPALAGLLTALLLISSALACEVQGPEYTPSAPQITAGALNATYEAGASLTAAAPTRTPTATATTTPSATATDTPTSSIVELPTLGAGTYIYEVTPDTGALSDADVRALAHLCTVEVRGMGERRDAACISVVSTVFERMTRRELSDGTVRGTIAWGCTPGAQECQFPAYVVNGCAGIQPSACPQSYPDSVTHFTIVVYEYLRLRALADGACEGYFYYGIKPFDYGGCRITGPSGSEGFHD